MTDPLTDLRSSLLLWLMDYYGSPGHAADIATQVVAAIPPDKADAMRAGLLRSEVEAALDPGKVWRSETSVLHLRPGPEHWVRYIGKEYRRRRVYLDGFGPTLLAALTDLLGKLRGEA